MDDPLEDAETLKLDRKGLILELGKTPSSYKEIEGQYLGLIKIRADHVEKFKNVYERINPKASYDGQEKPQMYMTSFIQYLIDTGWAVQSVPINSGWLEVDTRSELQMYNRMFADNSLGEFCDLDLIISEILN